MEKKENKEGKNVKYVIKLTKLTRLTPSVFILFLIFFLLLCFKEKIRKINRERVRLVNLNDIFTHVGIFNSNNKYYRTKITMIE